MKIGSMNNPRVDVLGEIERIGQSKYDFIDLTYEWPVNAKFDIKKIKDSLEKYSLEVVGHTSPSLPAIYPMKEVREACVNELKRSIDALSEVGAKTINIHPFFFTGYKIEKDILAENIKLLSIINNYCRSAGIELMLENFITPFDDPKTFAELLLYVPGLKIHLDIGHLNFSSNNLEAILSLFLNKFPKDIAHCHIHDNHARKDEHLPLGCGNIEWPLVASMMKKAGYDRTFTIEVFCSDRHYLNYSREQWKKIWEES
jgi:sugar phosphate isomerase/epimerase